MWARHRVVSKGVAHESDGKRVLAITLGPRSLTPVPQPLPGRRTQAIFDHIPIALLNATARRLCLRVSATQQWTHTVVGNLSLKQGHCNATETPIHLPAHFSAGEACVPLAPTCGRTCKVEVVDEYGNTGTWESGACGAVDAGRTEQQPDAGQGNASALGSAREGQHNGLVGWLRRLMHP